MARVVINIGDVFFVWCDGYKRFFQYVANDLTQLNSDVIRAFKKKYNDGETPQVNDIVRDEVDFYAHCITKLGVKMNLWEKIGNSKDVGLVTVYFRDTNDYEAKVGGEPPKRSENWYVWRINDADFTRVGKLTGELQKAEIGMVFSPIRIVNRLKTGEYGIPYPGF